MPIDLKEVTDITMDLAELVGQITLLQIELSKPIKRIKMLTMAKDQFGDEITDEQKDTLFAKAKAEHEKCKEACSKSIRELPKIKREIQGQ